MKIKINGVEHVMVRHFSSDTRFYDSWSVISDGLKLSVHSLPKYLKTGDKFRTSGNNYEVIEKNPNE